MIDDPLALAFATTGFVIFGVIAYGFLVGGITMIAKRGETPEGLPGMDFAIYCGGFLLSLFLAFIALYWI